MSSSLFPNQGTQNPQPNNLRTQYQQFRQMFSSPTNLLQAVNPSVGQFIRNYGNPQAAFYALAQQKGVDPESILSQLR